MSLIWVLNVDHFGPNLWSKLSSKRGHFRPQNVSIFGPIFGSKMVATIAEMGVFDCFWTSKMSPKMSPFWVHFDAKNDPFFGPIWSTKSMIFGSILDPKMIHFQVHFGLQNRSKMIHFGAENEIHFEPENQFSGRKRNSFLDLKFHFGSKKKSQNRCENQIRPENKIDRK